MLTQCPHCLTLFRVGPEHLKAAAGQVRCCRCHRVFNALQSLQEAPSPFVNSRIVTGSQADDRPTGGLPPDTPEPLEEVSDWQAFQADSDGEAFKPMLPDFEPTEPADELLDELLEQDDGLDPEPDYLTSGSESQMSELLDQDSSSILLPDAEEPGETPSPDRNVIAFSPSATQAGGDEPSPDRQALDVTYSIGPDTEETTPALDEKTQDEVAEEETFPSPQISSEVDEPPNGTPDFEDSILKDEAIDEELGKPDYDSVPAFRLEPESESESEPDTPDDADRALNFEAVTTPRRRSRLNPLWLIGSLLLAVPLSGQIAWQFRDSLIRHDAGRQALQLICQVAGCEVPTRRALEKIAIQGRNLTTHPDKPDTLFLQVSIVNTAGFEQPFPRLSLSLYNDKGALIARRTFSASEYLPSPYKDRRMMPRAEPILVEMELVDPGKEVTGFSFDFF